jgi:hypothetical protein
MVTQLNGSGGEFEGKTNDQIGEFCLATHRKMAKDVFAIGKAIKVVYDRIGGKKGEFKAWREKYVPYLSKATVYRYLAIAELDPAQIGENEGITELYRRLHILPAKPPADSTPTTGQSGKGTKKAVTKETPTPDSAGVAKVDDTQPSANEIGMAVPTTEPTAREDIQSQDEDMTQEQEQDFREAEVAAALIVAGKLAAKHGVSGDPKNLVAFLGEFGVQPGDIGALNTALAAA